MAPHPALYYRMTSQKPHSPFDSIDLLLSTDSVTGQPLPGGGRGGGGGTDSLRLGTDSRGGYRILRRGMHTTFSPHFDPPGSAPFRNYSPPPTHPLFFGWGGGDLWTAPGFAASKFAVIILLWKLKNSPIKSSLIDEFICLFDLILLNHCFVEFSEQF